MLADEHTPSTSSWSKQAEKQRREHIKSRFKRWEDAGKKNMSYSLAGRILIELSIEAVKTINKDDPDRSLELENKLDEVNILVHKLMHAAMSYEVDYEKREEPDFWHHNKHNFSRNN